MEDPDKNNVINRGMSEIHQVSNLFNEIVTVVADFINVIISGVAIFYFMPNVLLIIVAWVVLRNIPLMRMTKEMYQYGFKNTENRRLFNHILEYILSKTSLIELTIHNAANYIKEKYNSLISVYLEG